MASPTRKSVGGTALRILAARARRSAPSSSLAPVNSVPTAVASTVAEAAAVATAFLLPAIRRKGTERGKGKKDKKPAAAAPAVSILKTHVPQAVPGSVALAAAYESYEHGPAENCRSWLLDTGCKYDLTTRASVPPHLQDSIMKATVPITLPTANVLVNGDQVVRQHIGEFGEVAEPMHSRVDPRRPIHRAQLC